MQNIKELEIFIYDRWGQLVFESKEINFKWDGKVNGVWIPNHVFSYALRITTVFGKKQVYKESSMFYKLIEAITIIF